MRGLPAILILSLAAGCERDAPLPVVAPPVTPEQSDSPWRTAEDSTLLAVPAEQAAALSRAIDLARASAADASELWAAADPRARGRWAVKWEAPTADRSLEYVWVRPLSWDRHRIEGVLASPPQRPLQCDRVAGELVAFPVSELADWVHYVDGSPDGRREGGFTIDALEARFGQPP